MRSLILIILILFTLSPSLAEAKQRDPLSMFPQTTECKKDDGLVAEVITDYLDSWDNMHLAYVQFGPCYAMGGPAEGIAESVIHLLLDKWPDVAYFQHLAIHDKNFGHFVLSHIDLTLNSDEVGQLKKVASTSCSKETKIICTKILQRIDELDKEAKEEEKQ
jgi:hypothetical protein